MLKYCTLLHTKHHQPVLLALLFCAVTCSCSNSCAATGAVPLLHLSHNVMVQQWSVVTWTLGEQAYLNARLGLSPPCSTEPETAQVIALSPFHTLGPSTMEGTTRPMAPAGGSMVQ